MQDFTFTDGNGIVINDVAISIPDGMVWAADEGNNIICVPTEFAKEQETSGQPYYDAGTIIVLSNVGISPAEAKLIWKFQSAKSIGEQIASMLTDTYGVSANVFCAKANLVIVWVRRPAEQDTIQFMVEGPVGQISGFILFNDSNNKTKNKKNALLFFEKMHIAKKKK